MCFFFNDTATTEIYTLSLHDALPIFEPAPVRGHVPGVADGDAEQVRPLAVEVLDELERRGLLALQAELVDRVDQRDRRSEEHTSELQSRQYLVCRLLLEKKNNTIVAS